MFWPNNGEEYFDIDEMLCNVDVMYVMYERQMSNTFQKKIQCRLFLTHHLQISQPKSNERESEYLMKGKHLKDSLTFPSVAIERSAR